MEDRHSVNGNEMMLMSGESECEMTDGELTSAGETASTNPFRSHHRQPPSFEQILARSGLRLSDLAIVALPEADPAPSESEAASESTLPPPGNYARHPNLYLPPYSIASETEAEDNASLRLRALNDFHHELDDMDDSPSSHSSFASQIHRPIVTRTTNRSGTAVAASAASGDQTSLSMASFASQQGSCSDLSQVCDIEDSEFEMDDAKTTASGKKTSGPPLQTAV